MRSPRHDQAEGLRRLLERGSPRLLTLRIGGDGRIGAMMHLAAALAEAGSEVLILDAGVPGQGIAAQLGLAPAFDLEDVIRRGRAAEEIVLHGPAGIRLLPLGRGARPFAQLPAAEQEQLLARCAGSAVDTVLTELASGGAGSEPWPGSLTEEIIVVSGSSAAAITAGYAVVKQRAQEAARREFHLLVAEVADEAQARAVSDNMARVARRYLQVSLSFIGHVPAEERRSRAARSRLPLASAFPAATVAAAYRRLAQAIRALPRVGEDAAGFAPSMRRLINVSRERAAAAPVSL